MQLIDTHCHIHEANYPDAEGAYQRALQNSVSSLICVGTNLKSSQAAVDFAKTHEQAWASIGLHPHEAKIEKSTLNEFAALLNFEIAKPGVTSGGPEGRTRGMVKSKIVAIGECGLDYFYNHSPKKDQITVLRFQIELALECDLPLTFHVRDAFDDFWPIFDDYPTLQGVVHSFTDNQANLEKLLSRGLYMGVNGIMSFTKHAWQLALIKQAPLKQLVLETDAPFLTPVPHRGTVNEPARVLQIAEFLARIRDDSLEDIAAMTTHNARQLFSI